MHALMYENIGVKGQHLTFAGLDTSALAEQFGTPLLLMDEDRVRNRCRVYKEAMADFLPAGSHPIYASKALSMQAMYRIMQEENMGIDVVSAGEVYTAKSAGFPMENAYFHGTAKTDRDIAFAMDAGVGCFVSDTVEELDAIQAAAEKRGICQKVLLRLAPGIDAHTHEKINTGRVDSKFGAAITTGQAESLTRHCLGLKNVELMGYHCHIGSQIFAEVPFCQAAEMMLSFLKEMEDQLGFVTRVLNLGGGMGVPYVSSDPKINYRENIRLIGQIIDKYCLELGLNKPVILMEPGRSIVADSGITLYRVVNLKHIPGVKNYVSIDGGMTDNPRYALYQAAYTVLPADRMEDKADMICSVAGCCCESGDLIQEKVALPTPKRGDLLAVLTTGAYNYSMASNYNRVPRPAVVMVKGGTPYVAVERESFEDLVKNDR